MPRLPARKLVRGLQRTLTRQHFDYQRFVDQLGQVKACQARERGHHFSLVEHVRALILSQLSCQRPWGPIAANLPRLKQIFRNYDPDALEVTDPVSLTNAILALHCGNRQLARQMKSLAANIRLLRKIESDHGGLDRFVVSADPDIIATRLGRSGPLKLKQVGYTLAMEYLKNVGVRAAKPDVHIRRALGGGRLGYVDHHPSEAAAYRLIGDLAAEADCNSTYLDNLLWLFCAKNYGNICGADPNCKVCAFRDVCNYAQSLKTNGGR